MPVPLCVSVFVTTTFTAPAVPDGVVQVIVVAFVTEGEVQVFPPTVTVAPLKNPVPVIVIEVPPGELIPQRVAPIFPMLLAASAFEHGRFPSHVIGVTRGK